MGYPRMAPSHDWQLVSAENSASILARTPEHGFCLPQSLGRRNFQPVKTSPGTGRCHFRFFHWLKHAWSLLSFKRVKKVSPSFVKECQGHVGFAHLWKIQFAALRLVVAVV